MATSMDESSYSICNMRTHRRNHRNTTPIAKVYHLLCHSLRCHEDTCDVYLKHCVCILGGIFHYNISESASLLQD